MNIRIVCSSFIALMSTQIYAVEPQTLLTTQAPIAAEPTTAPTAESKTTTTPEPITTTTLEPKTTTTPQPKTTTPPEPMTATPPEPMTATTPEPITATTPEPITATPPEPMTSTTPEPMTATTPEPMTATTPEPKTTTNPEPKTTTNPEPITATTPEPKTTTTPEPITATTPEPITATTPEPITATTPEPITATTPEPITATTPEPITATTPEPITATTPEPITATTPEPITAAPVLPLLNCDYKIPADIKTVDKDLVLKWSEKAVIQSFSFNSATIDSQMQKLEPCFTEQGWTGFNAALQKSGNLDTIKSQKLSVTSHLDGVVLVNETKENQWKFTVPITVVYKNDTEKVSQLLRVDLTVKRKLNGDLGITQMIAAPRTTDNTMQTTSQDQTTDTPKTENP